MRDLSKKKTSIFFWLKKKEPVAKPPRKTQAKAENMTIASFWQTQLMNIADDNNIKK